MPPKIVNLNSYKSASRDDDDDDGAPSGPGPNNLFVGGGQNVIGGPRDKGGRGAAGDVIKQASERAKAEGAAAGALGEATSNVVITMYENGFTVKMGAEAEGELRDYDKPESKDFLGSIRSGRRPKELAGVEDLMVSISDKMEEKFVPPAYRKFGGTSAAVGKADVSATAVVRGKGAGSGAVTVDPSAPTTRVQVKLLNGKRETVTLNLSHTVGDLQSMVAAMNGAAGKAFYLAAGFPPKPLDVSGATIEAAGLKNASVTQMA